MLIAVINLKGGVGKTTSAIHLAASLQQRGTTLLLDGDPNRQSLEWARHNKLPFVVADLDDAAAHVGRYDHTVIDTEQFLSADDFQALAAKADLLVVPAAPGILDTFGLMETIVALRKIQCTRYRVLLVQVPPPPEHDAIDLRRELRTLKIPLFKTEIPRLKAFSRAAARGVIVDAVTDDPRAGRAWAAYAAAGKELFR